MSPRLGSRVRRALARVTRFAAPRPAPPVLRILTYHRVNDEHPHDRLSVPRAAFAAQMEELARAGYAVVKLEEALPALRGGGLLPQPAVSITFDDGYADNFEAALPILERHGFAATFFLATGFVGSSATLDRYRDCCRRDGMLGWAQVRELLARGQSIGGHGRHHRELAALGPAEVREELSGCADDIERKTGARPRLFCYPRGSESASVRQAAAAAGYVGACTVRPGANPAGVDPFALRRTEVAGHDDLADFRLKLGGGFDGWHRLLQAARGSRES
jgi:peptidoglycan/xylan/chitin deacetylase (PgdA/CDA1 family)